ncbi:MAG: hypothetical protein RL245_829, partial [Pseudomonadota bacterium]
MSAQPQFHSSLFREFSSDDVLVSPEECRAYSSDVYSEGCIAAAVLRPRDTQTCAAMLKQASHAGYSIIPRGGGLSYTGGYRPINDKSVIIDTSRLTRIIEVNPQD